MCWKPRAAGAGTAGLGGCGEGWLGFQIHWFTEKPAREGQGAACLVIVIVLITPAGSEQDPTLRQVPHHPLSVPPSPPAPTIPAEHPGRPGPCSAPKVAPNQRPHPCQTSRVTSGATLSVQPLTRRLLGEALRGHRWFLGRCWEGGAGIPVMLRGVTRVPGSCQSLRTVLLLSAGAGRLVCVGSGPGALAQPVPK